MDPNQPAPPDWQSGVSGNQERPTGDGPIPDHAEHGLAPAATGPSAPPSLLSPQSRPVEPALTISRAAIFSFVLGILGFTVVAAVVAIFLGIVAMMDIRAGHYRGKGLAVAGIVIGSGWFAFFAVLLAIGLFAGGSAVNGSAYDHQVWVAPQDPGLPSLGVGDCIDLPIPKLRQVISTVTETPCTEPHNAQVFAMFNDSGSPFNYPGPVQLESLADSGCRARIGSAVDQTKLTTSMTRRYLYPSISEWLGGDQTISCMVYSPTSTLTSSLLKS